MRKAFSLFLLSPCLFLAACSSMDGGMMKDNHKAALNLMQAAGPEINRSVNMIAASFANIDNLSSSSSFGRVASQQLVSEFTARGYDFVDILLRKNIYVSEGDGEFLLSREIEAIGTDYAADVVLVGTYAVGDRQVFITARLIRTRDGIIVASHDYAIPFRGETRALITGEAGNTSNSWQSLLGLPGF